MAGTTNNNNNSDDGAREAERRPGRSRRGLLAGAAAGLGALAAEAIAPAQPAQAALANPPVLLGTDNTVATARTGIFTTNNSEWAQLADPGDAGLGSLGVYAHGQDRGVYADVGGSNGTGVIALGGGDGVHGIGGGNGVGVSGIGGGVGVEGLGGGSSAGVIGTGGASGGGGVIANGGSTRPVVTALGQGVVGNAALAAAGVTGTGGPSDGTGVVGTGGGSNGVGVFATGSGAGDGVRGNASTGNGVHGAATAATGVGVLAENFAGGTAFEATGPAVFRRSGILTVAAGSSKGTVTGVALTAASLVLATSQQNLSGVYVRCAVPNVAGSSFTINLSKAPSASATVAWFIVN